MDIYRLLVWDLKKLEWEDTPIRDDDEVVTVESAKYIEKLSILTNLGRSENRDIFLHRTFFHRTRFHSLISSEWLVWIRHDKNYFKIMRRYNVSKDITRESWCPKKSDSYHA